jgi:hypothetical protein
MCVVLAVKSSPIPRSVTVDTLRDMWRTNPHGGGVAWHDGERLHVIRGIMNQTEWIDAVRGPISHGWATLAHARIDSVGQVRPALTHPWPVYTAPIPSSRAEGLIGVMAHNGHYSPWDTQRSVDPSTPFADPTVPFDYLAGTDAPTDPADDPWSDSRYLAHCATVYGLESALTQARAEWKGQRVVFLTAAGQFRFAGDWSKLAPGIRVSNRYYERAYVPRKYSMADVDAMLDRFSLRQTEPNRTAEVRVSGPVSDCLPATGGSGLSRRARRRLARDIRRSMAKD